MMNHLMIDGEIEIPIISSSVNQLSPQDDDTAGCFKMTVYNAQSVAFPKKSHLTPNAVVVFFVATESLLYLEKMKSQRDTQIIS